MARNPDDEDEEYLDSEDTDDGFKEIESVEDGDEFKRDWCV